MWALTDDPGGREAAGVGELDPVLDQDLRGIEVGATVEGAWGALVNQENGVLVALAERHADKWQPRVVMREA